MPTVDDSDSSCHHTEQLRALVHKAQERVHTLPTLPGHRYAIVPEEFLDRPFRHHMRAWPYGFTQPWRKSPSPLCCVCWLRFGEVRNATVIVRDGIPNFPRCPLVCQRHFTDPDAPPCAKRSRPYKPAMRKARPTSPRRDDTEESVAVYDRCMDCEAPFRDRRNRRRRCDVCTRNTHRLRVRIAHLASESR